MHYIIKYQPPRPTFADDASPEESVIIEQHFEYLKKLLADEKLLLAGRTDDAHLGIAILITNDEDEARTLMENDPAVKNNIFKGELHLFRLALHLEN